MTIGIFNKLSTVSTIDIYSTGIQCTVGYTGACKLKSDHTVGYTGANVQMVCFKQNSIQR
jgi:hypothetical protein